MTKEEVQQKIELTPNQKKAFNELEKAVKECRKTNIWFYQVLETLNALNGNNVQSVECIDDPANKGIIYEDPRNLQYLNYPGIETECSFADDTHIVKLK